MKRQLILTGILLLGLGIAGSAQDSLKLSMPEAEKMFIAGNYELIAQQYQTEICFFESLKGLFSIGDNGDEVSLFFQSGFDEPGYFKVVFC
jgi:hypothetical protein